MYNKKSAQDAIFDEVMVQCLKVHNAVYPYIAPPKTPLPFVYVGEQYDNDTYTKGNVHGYVTQRVHIYGEINKRGDVGVLASSIRNRLRALNRAGGYQVNCRDSNQTVMVDQSTTTPLWHYVVEVQYKYT